MKHRTPDATPNIPNELLKYARGHEGLSPDELAEKLTKRAKELRLEIPPKSEQYEGLIDERTVRRWESGESRRPDRAHKKVLENYFDRNIEALGFTKKGRP